MKLAVCVSNQPMKIKKGLLRPFGRALSGQPDWAGRLCTALDEADIAYTSVYIDHNDWIEQVVPLDVLVWKPRYLGVLSSQWLKEKIYFMQHVMHKRVFPNYETVWHYDSKIAQKYFFQYHDIAAPATFVSFNYNESVYYGQTAALPQILKLSSGSASQNVTMVQSRNRLLKLIDRRFLWNKLIAVYYNRFIGRRTGLNCIMDRFGYFYAQDFAHGNQRDIRVTVIGNRYAYAFYRINRKGDFRASGSGNIDYYAKISSDIITYCVGLNRRFGFDSMCYDILLKNNKPVVLEMSYGYDDQALYDAPGYYRFTETGELDAFVSGNCWPQALWAAWIQEQMEESLR